MRYRFADDKVITIYKVPDVLSVPMYQTDYMFYIILTWRRLYGCTSQLYVHETKNIQIRLQEQNHTEIVNNKREYLVGIKNTGLFEL